MRITDLSPQFLAHPVIENGRVCWPHVSRIEEAAGVMFLCPKCFDANGGPVGTESVICWSPKVSPESYHPSPGRWVMEGTGYADLTLKEAPGKSPSVLLTTEGGCKAHFFVRGGEIQMC